MKRFLLFFGAAVTFLSCERVDLGTGDSSAGRYGDDLSHDAIVLGRQLDDPYRTENVTRALAALYPTKADRVNVETTDYYVRFLPANQEEFDFLKSLGIELLDHPVDYEIVKEGDWYHDPSVEEENITWQYAVVPKGFSFPEVKYQILHECYIASHDSSTKAADEIDWAEVERKSYELTGNGSLLAEAETLTRGGRVTPSGRLTIVDDAANGGKPFGVSGVMVSCNAFVKFATAYTDRDGYYTMNKEFSSKIRYRIVFKNERNFALGLNLILVPASVSTLGKAEPDGISMTITRDSDEKLFRRCVVNNAVYDYIGRCDKKDMNIGEPPKDLRIWLLSKLEPSSTPMIHQGAVVSHPLIAGFLGPYALLVKLFAPDITLGMSGKNDYKSIYSTVNHELAHASHYAKVGNDYWNKYVEYILTSFVSSGTAYGSGKEDGAGYCEVGEMWAYYLQCVMEKDRYGGKLSDSGEYEWFRPQILKYIGERGVSRGDIFKALDGGTASLAAFKTSLIKARPDKRAVIEQAFSRYSKE